MQINLIVLVLVLLIKNFVDGRGSRTSRKAVAAPPQLKELRRLIREIMASNIFKTLVDNADFMIDFHCGHNAETRWTLFNEDGSPEAKKSMELAKAFGIEIIYPCDIPPFPILQFERSLQPYGQIECDIGRGKGRR